MAYRAHLGGVLVEAPASGSLCGDDGREDGHENHVRTLATEEVRRRYIENNDAGSTKTVKLAATGADLGARHVYVFMGTAETDLGGCSHAMRSSAGVGLCQENASPRGGWEDRRRDWDEGGERGQNRKRRNQLLLYPGGRDGGRSRTTTRVTAPGRSGKDKSSKDSGASGARAKWRV